MINIMLTDVRKKRIYFARYKNHAKQQKKSYIHICETRQLFHFPFVADPV